VIAVAVGTDLTGRLLKNGKILLVIKVKNTEL